MEEKKNLLTYAGLKKLEEELHDLKVVKRKEVAEKIKEAREQGRGTDFPKIPFWDHHFKTTEKTANCTFHGGRLSSEHQPMNLAGEVRGREGWHELQVLS